MLAFPLTLLLSESTMKCSPLYIAPNSSSFMNKLKTKHPGRGSPPVIWDFLLSSNKNVQAFMFINTIHRVEC